MISARTDQWLRIAALCLGIAVFSLVGSQAQIGPAPGGGGGTPGGSNTQCQFNNSGAFGGDSGCIYASGTQTLSTKSVAPSFGDGTNFQVKWITSPDTVAAFRNTADNAYIQVYAFAFFAGNSRYSYGQNGVFSSVANSANLTASDWRSAMQALEFGSGAGMSWATTSNQDSGTYDTGISRNAAGVVEVNNATAGAFRDVLVRQIITSPVAVGSLQTCNSGNKGARAFVTDSNAVSFTAGIGAVVAAGGSTNVPVVCDGTNWRIG
jgi:hypothetical protein